MIEPQLLPRNFQVIDLLFKQKDYEGAADALAEARKRFPKAGLLTYYHAVALSQIKNHDEAMRAFERALVEAGNSQPDMLNADFYFDYGAAAEQAGQYVKASELFRKSIELDPDNAARSYNYLGYMWVERSENLEEAGQLIRRALEMDPQNGAYVDSLGWLYFKQGKFEEALTELLRAAELLAEPDPVVFEHIGDTFDKLGRNAEAVLYWQKALQLNPENKVLATKLDKSTENVAKQPRSQAPVTHKLQRIDRRNQPLFRRFAQETADGCAAFFAVVERQLVYVHPDKSVCERNIQPAGVSHAVRDGRCPMFQPIGDAFAQNVTDFAPYPGRYVFTDDIATEGEGQLARALPPLSQVEHAGKALLRIGKLAFVNDQSRRPLHLIAPMRKSRRKERRYSRSSAQEELGREECARHPAGHGDSFAEQPVLFG